MKLLFTLATQVGPQGMINKRVFVTAFLLQELLLVSGGLLLARMSSNPNDQEFGTPKGLLLLVGYSLPFVALFAFVASAIASKGK